MGNIFIPFKVTSGDKIGIWQIDVSNLNTLELIELKECFKNMGFSSTISALDKLIYTNMDEFNCSSDLFGNGYRKEMKRNSKIEMQNKMKKEKRKRRRR